MLKSLPLLKNFTYMNIKELNFDTMLASPTDILKSDNPIEDISIFKRYPSFSIELSDNLSKSRVLAYITLIYDMNSPLQTTDDIIRRKGEAAELCNFPKNRNGSYEVVYMNVIEGRNPEINQMTIDYCKIQRNKEFTELNVYNDLFYNFMVQLKNTTDAKEQKTIMDNIQNIKRQYAIVYSDFTSKDFNKTLDKQVVDAIELETMELRPENISALLAEGKPPVNLSPYGKNYKFKKHEPLTD